MNTDLYRDADSRIKAERLPSLTALRCFEAAARTENFGRAAEALNLTHGAISRAVRLIEDDLGVALFERRSRRVFLTTHGRRLAEAVRQGFDTIAAAATALRNEAGGGRIILSCEPTLLMRWLIPRLTAFERDHPEITLHLVAGGGPVRLGGDIDFALRRADFPIAPEAHLDPLFDERVGPVCRADLVDHFFETGGGAAILRGHAPLLHTRTRPDAWATWARASGHVLSTRGSRAFDHFHLSLQAALSGVGVAIGPWQMVRDEVEKGILAAPMGFVPDGSRYVLLSQSSRHKTQKTSYEALLSWLRQSTE